MPENKYRRHILNGQDVCLINNDRLDTLFSRVSGCVTWPGENAPGFVAVAGDVAIGKNFRNKYIVLAEFESWDPGELFSKASEWMKEYLVELYYTPPVPKYWQYLAAFNESQRRLKKNELTMAPAISWSNGEIDYHLAILRDQLRPGSSTLYFNRGSFVPGKISALPKTPNKIKDTDFPAVAGIAYLVTMFVLNPYQAEPEAGFDRCETKYEVI